MQMSRERFQEVHKLIWNTVIAHIEDVRKRNCSVYFLKQVGIGRAYERGLLDSDERELIESNNFCLLCVSCESCRSCVLQSCNSTNSLYYHASRGDKDAMIKIRDIVDKKPFTELSIITLYDWRD